MPWYLSLLRRILSHEKETLDANTFSFSVAVMMKFNLKKWIFVATVNILVIIMVISLFIAYGIIEEKGKKEENVVLSYEGRGGKCFC